MPLRAGVTRSHRTTEDQGESGVEADSPEPGSPERPIVLCVDDDPGSLAGLHDARAEALRDDAVLERAASGPAAIRFIEAAFGQGLPVAVLVVAEDMRELRGHQLLQQLTQLAPQIRAILIDGPVPSSDIGAAVNTGILDGLLRKPLQRGDMLGAVRSALQRWHQARRATQTQRMLEFLLQGDPSAVLLLDADNRPVHWNAAAHRIIARLADGGNLTDLSGSVLESLQREAIQNPARAGQRLTSGMEDPSSFVQQAVYGPGPDGVWAYRLTDVTESIRTSQALERSLASDGERQRIEALGMMTGAMIHELNNYLFVIGSTAELLTEQLPHETELKADLMQAVEHAGTMAGQMLSFVRNDPTETEIFEVLPSIRQAVSFGRRLAAFDSQFEIAAPDAQLWTECASMHLQQIVLNLIKNALDAAGDAPSRVEISVQAGDPLLIRVRDHGPGIPAAVVPQLFKPVMTTKEAGTGAGIGLTISRRLARMHGGDLRYAESHGAGATFELLLPAADAPVRSGIAG
ncbi:MAG: ATP-binding protein, partial [Myxococcota bacterium]|nr:ATP-binding protein [Myxococcota bacterium]